MSQLLNKNAGVGRGIEEQIACTYQSVRRTDECMNEKKIMQSFVKREREKNVISSYQDPKVLVVHTHASHHVDPHYVFARASVNVYSPPPNSYHSKAQSVIQATSHVD